MFACAVVVVVVTDCGSKLVYLTPSSTDAVSVGRSRDDKGKTRKHRKNVKKENKGKRRRKREDTKEKKKRKKREKQRGNKEENKEENKEKVFVLGGLRWLQSV